MVDRVEAPRVVHVITRLIVGGAQLTAIDVCAGLSDRYDLSLLSGTETGPEGSLREYGQARTEIRDFPRLTRGIDPRVDVPAVLQLHRLFKSLRPDIVHTHSSKAGIVGRLAAHGTGARTVHTVHGWGHTPADHWLRRQTFVSIERAMARWTDTLVAVSDDVRLEGVARKIGRPDQYAVIPEMVDLTAGKADFAASRASARSAIGLSDSRSPVIGWVGRFVPQKDPATLARALARILTEVPDAQAVLIGDGPLRPDVEATVASAGVADRVIFTGLRPDARRLMPAVDVLLHPSRWEGQPRVVQEALAERIPVVGTRVAGVADLVLDDVNGFVVDPEDAEAMASRAVEVIRTANLEAPLPARALEHLSRVAGAERCLEDHDRLYTRLLSARS